MSYICRFYVNGNLKLICNSKKYKENYLKLCDKYGYKNISVEKILIGRKDDKLNTIIKQIRESMG